MIGALLGSWKWIAMAALVAALGVQSARVYKEKQRFDTYRATAELNARLASEEQRRVETVRQFNIDKEVANAQPIIDAEVRDARVARVDVRVRDAATRYVYRACPNPKPASAGPPAPDARVVYADVLGRIDARASELAEIAGQRGAAGALCENYADALTTKSP